MAADHRYLKNIYLDVYAADPPVRAVYMYDETVLILVSNSIANLSFWGMRVGEATLDIIVHN